VNLTLVPPLAAAVEARLAGLDADRLPARLWQRDPSVWSADPGRRQPILDRLGWLAAPGAMLGSLGTLRAFADGVASEGFTHAVLLGMGGSSLAAEVLRDTPGVRRGGLALTILDDTAPAAVRTVSETHDPERTLFIVSSKSGSTVEVTAFERTFFAWSSAVRGARVGRAFVAVTDPGTPLERLAHERGYREVFHGAPDIGGRYSALSPFGMVPAALLGLDLEALAASARAEIDSLRGERSARDVPGVRLGAVLGELALHGRDKLTLVLDAGSEPVGAWIEQLMAESTGKDGRGIVPVVGESLGLPESYGNDRVFVALGSLVETKGPGPSLSALASAGQPLIAWDPTARGLGAEFVRWEIATATAAAILRVNPFDEPNVTEAKQATQSALEAYLASGRFPDETPITATGAVEVHAPSSVVDQCRGRIAAPAEAAAWLPAMLSLAAPGDYIALLAYLHRTPERHERLQRLRDHVRVSTRAATTLGYGPRYLHSTGQLHKGGPDIGLFLQLTEDPGEEQAVPGQRFGYAALQRAQAAGDHAALERRGRRLLRVHLGRDVEAGLDALIEAVSAKSRL
jgi:glucose-6-phosphate isomerase